MVGIVSKTTIEVDLLFCFWTIIVAFLTGYFFHQCRTPVLQRWRKEVPQSPVVTKASKETTNNLELFKDTAFCTDEPYAVLLGVGPGDPSLLTVAALKVLAEAELVLCDRLVSIEILDLLQEINPACEIRMSSKCKKRSNSSKVQNELNQWIVEGLNRKLKVCRLKGGDPFVFGRGMEEVEAVLNRNYKIKVIPGISSGFSAPLAAGLSVTKRNAANKVLVATAHGQFDTYPDMPSFRKDCTLIFLMGISRLETLMGELIEKGFPVSTDVCIVERATTAYQRQISGTIDDIYEIAKLKGIRAPATIIVGTICKNDELTDTFKTRYENGGVIYSPM